MVNDVTTDANAGNTNPDETNAGNTGVLTYRRRGRVTSGQQRALAANWDRFGHQLTGHELNPAALFNRPAPLILDIGFGQGDATVTMAARDPERHVLAVDVHRPGAGALLAALAVKNLNNVRVIIDDAHAVLQALPPDSLAEVRVYFPDPWPKSRHHKRRLIRTTTAHLIATRLAPNGILHIATDWTPYAGQILAVIKAEPLLHNDYAGYAPRPSTRPVTTFERRGLDRGHPVHDILARRVAGLDTVHDKVAK